MTEKNYLEGETGLKIVQTGVGEVGALTSLSSVYLSAEVMHSNILFLTDKCMDWASC